MSATGRGGERSADDFYETPAWATDALIRRIGPVVGKRILEPSAGAGGIVRRLIAAGAKPDDITAIEVDEARAERCGLMLNCFGAVHGRFEEWVYGPLGEAARSLTARFDLVVMNPPFSLAEEHIRLAILLLAPGGLCCALERLAFGCSRKRAAFRKAYPYDKIELACRPGFTPDGGTDAADYAWFLFGTRADGSPCGGRFEVAEEGRGR